MGDFTVVTKLGMRSLTTSNPAPVPASHHRHRFNVETPQFVLDLPADGLQHRQLKLGEEDGAQLPGEGVKHLHNLRGELTG